MNNPFNQTLTFILKIRPFRVFDLKKRYDSSNSNKVSSKSVSAHSDMKRKRYVVFFASSHFAVESQLRIFTSGNFASSLFALKMKVRRRAWLQRNTMLTYTFCSSLELLSQKYLRTYGECLVSVIVSMVTGIFPFWVHKMLHLLSTEYFLP